MTLPAEHTDWQRLRDQRMAEPAAAEAYAAARAEFERELHPERSPDRDG